jgi:hypothetical protein
VINFKTVLAGVLLAGVLGAVPAAATPVVKHVGGIHLKKGAWVCGYRNRFGEVVQDYRCWWRPYSFYFDGPVRSGKLDLEPDFYVGHHHRWHHYKGY